MHAYFSCYQLLFKYMNLTETLDRAALTSAILGLAFAVIFLTIVIIQRDSKKK